MVAFAPFPPEHHTCPACALRYVDLNAPAAIELIRSYPARYRSCLLDLPDRLVRRRPRRQTWSALEYACHVRDIYDVYHLRILRALTEELPVLAPMRNEERAERGGYNQQDLAEVLNEMERNVGRFVELAEHVEEDGWTRAATRLPGERRTVLWMLRQAAHEGLHHLHDIVAAAMAPSSPACHQPPTTGAGREVEPMAIATFPHSAAERVIASALAEDAAGDDITTRWSVAEGLMARAEVVTRQTGIAAGLPAVAAVFAQIDKHVEIEQR
jgi:DinB superfamily/Quinolinate phosphoribosyl transferase, N-terminal domain